MAKQFLNRRGRREHGGFKEGIEVDYVYGFWCFFEQEQTEVLWDVLSAVTLLHATIKFRAASHRLPASGALLLTCFFLAMEPSAGWLLVCCGGKT
jgi:hypothetical protein